MSCTTTGDSLTSSTIPDGNECLSTVETMSFTFLCNPFSFKLAEIVVHSGGNLFTLRFIFSNGEFH